MSFSHSAQDPSARSSSTPSAGRTHDAGLFDIRTIIGALLLVYGVLLVGAGLLGDPALDKTGGVNANLLTGGALLLAGALFVVWARLRPVKVPAETGTGEERTGGH